MLVMNRKRVVLLALFCAAVSLQFVLVPNGFCTGINEVETEKIAVDLVRDVQKGGYGIVRTDELKKWMDQGKEMLIVFTGPEAKYKKAHYPGAVQFEFPIPELKEMSEKEKSSFIKMLGSDKERILVFYCGFTKCTRSHNGAMWAKKLGYHNVYRCPGGIKGWVEAGFPVEKAN
jgi:thiosulfate/3-mercaptopyruvate sulfurtransferase